MSDDARERDEMNDDCGSYYARQLTRLRMTRYQRTGPATTFVFLYGDASVAEVVITDQEGVTFGGASTYALNLMIALRSRIDPPHLVNWFESLLTLKGSVTR